MVQYLIEYRTPLTHEFIMKKNFYPFLVYMGFLVLYCNWIFPTIMDLREGGFGPMFWSFFPFAALSMFMLFTLSIYFFVSELT